MTVKCLDYRIQMVSNNRIQCVADTKTVEWNGVYKIYNDITGLQPLRRVFSRKKIGVEEISILLHAMGSLGEEVKRNMLDLSDFMFSPDMIFWDMNENKVRFIFNPGEEADDLTEYAQFLLENADNTEPEAVRIIYELYKRIRDGRMDTENLSDMFICETVTESIAEARSDIVEKKSEENKEERFPAIFAREEKKPSLFSRLFNKKNEEEAEYEDEALDLSAYGPIKETFEQNGGEETVLICREEYEKKYYLEGAGGTETEIRAEGNILVGSRAEYVDICLQNASVSKIHAQFSADGNGMTLVDLDSRNGTKINGRKITEETPVHDGDTIEFGTAAYVLRMK